MSEKRFRLEEVFKAFNSSRSACLIEIFDSTAFTNEQIENKIALFHANCGKEIVLQSEGPRNKRKRVQEEEASTEEQGVDLMDV